MPFATINGIKINYLIQGAGPHLLMFAPGGWRSVISRWTAAGGKEAFGQMDGLATLSRHFTCIAYDRRECGLSGGRVEPLDWDLYVEEAKVLLGIARRGLSRVRPRAREPGPGPVSRYLRAQPRRDLQRHHALGRKRRGAYAD